MRKLLPLSLFLWALAGSAWAQTCTTTISTFPHTEGFEGTNHGWTSGGTNSSWALGTPASIIISSAGTGTKAWATNLTGNYNVSEKSQVTSPCYNFTNLIAPIVELKVWWQSEFSFDGAVLQSSINNGTTWQNVGAFGDPNNWYNDNTINGAPGGQAAASAQGWTGRNASNNGSGGWVVARHALTGLAGQTSVRFRIAFGADGSGQDEGFAFDDFAIFESPANDAGVIAINSPTTPVPPGVPTPVTVVVKNYGIAPLTSAQIGFRVNNGTVTTINHTFTTPLAFNATSAPITIGNHNFPLGTHTVKAWTKSPNSAADANAGNDTTTVSVLACNSLSGTYTINQNSPATATNFTSFAAASQILNSCGVSGPVIFNVVSGSGPYNEQITLNSINGTNATNTVTYNGNSNTIIKSMAVATDVVLKLDGADYVRFNNFTITTDSANTLGTVVSLLNEANNNIFSNNTLNHSITNASTTYIVWLQSGSSNNTFQNNTMTGAYCGINNSGVAANLLTGNSFIGNTVKDMYSYGFYNSHSTNTLFEGNDISRPNRSNGSSLYGFYNTTGATQYTITKNRIHNTNDASISTTGTIYGVYSSGAGVAGSENMISNNVLYNINNNGGTLYAFHNSSGNNTYYYHNTVSADLPNITYNTLRGMYFTNASTNVKFINNILSLTSDASLTKHAVYLASSTINLISNNNNLFVGATGHIGYYSGNKTTMTNWLAANSGAYDQNSVSMDPLFIDASIGNLKPTNSQLNNTGQAVTAVTTDINGATRNTTTPDPGAFEFTPVANDASIIAFASPLTPVTPASNIPVKVIIKNNGTANLTSATISWIVNNVAQTSYSWTGNLANNQTDTATIGTYSFTTGAFDFEICSSLPNNATDGNPGNDCFTTQLISCTPMAGSYTINKNLPASATNFTSLSDAVTRVNSCGVSGPLTFTVATGTGPYNEQMVLGTISGTSATNTVTFEGNGNTISATPVGSNLGAVTLDGTDYVKINNFNIKLDSLVTAGCGVQLKNTADHNIISNNTVNIPLTTNSSGLYGILAGSSLSTSADNGNYNLIQNNVISGGYYSIQLNGPTAGAKHNQIIGNQIRDAFSYSIYLNNSDSTIIRGNDISRPVRNTIGTFYGLYVIGTNKNMEVSKNRFHNLTGGNPTSTSSAYVIYFSGTDAPVGSENVIKNNLIYDINSNGITYAITNSGSDGMHVIHNTIVLDNTNNSTTVRGIYQTTAATNIKVVNNIFTLKGSSGNKHALYFNTATSAITSDNNVFFIDTASTTNYLGYFSGNKTTLTDWQAANNGAYDSSSVAADPLYTNLATGNLRPASATVSNIGQPGTGVTDDINGALRNATTPDPGAYEFGIMPNDVGIVAISGPASGCGLTANDTIRVTIKNFGSNPQTSIPVSYSVDNSTPVNQTWTGTLASNATAVLIFTQPANLSSPGIHTIIASTQLLNDADTTNDADTLAVTNSLMPTGPVSLDFELPASGLNTMRVVTNANSRIYEDSAASTGTGFKGMIMDGVNNSSWTMPSAASNPWTVNPDNFSAVYVCFTPQAGKLDDSLFLEFDLKQLYKTTHFNTNFRVTVNGQQVGTTYNPPFGGYGTGVAPWTHVKLNISSFLNSPTIEIGLESSVKEEYDNGNGTANLIDNIMVQRVAGPTGIKENFLQSNVSIFPNPSTGMFNLKVPAATRNYSVEVTDLTGKVVKQQLVKNNSGTEQLNLNGTAKGIYILKITSEGNVATRKLVVE